MKKGTIIAIVVAFILILTGGVILMLGLSFAGTSEQDGVTMLTQSEHTIPEAFDSILIKTEDCDVTFAMVSGRGYTEVMITGEPERVSHSVTVEDGVLNVKIVDNRKWFDHIGIFPVEMDMVVYLPEAQYGSVRIYTATGDIQIPEEFHIAEAQLYSDTGRIDCGAYVTNVLTCFTATGDIDVRNCAPAMLNLDSDTGDIEVSAVTGTELQVKNDTGRTELENVSCMLLACESETGDVTLRSVQAEDYLQIFTDTGDVLIENSDAQTVNIETDTGDVSGSFLTPKWFQAHSDTGTVEVPNTREGGECRIQSDTGSIHIE